MSLAPETIDDILGRLRTVARTGDAGILDSAPLDQTLIPRMARDPEACALVEQRPDDPPPCTGWSAPMPAASPASPTNRRISS